MFRNIWKYSKIRFYILNTIWNYRFWLFAKKMYQETYFDVVTNEYEMDITFKLIPKKKKVKRRRFVGYLFNGAIYLDNPGVQGVDKDTMTAWMKKGLIK